MSDLLRALFPNWYKARIPEVRQEEQVIVDWLEREVDEDKIRRLSLLDVLRGWRNKEVYTYIKTWDWTARIYEKDK